MNQHTCHYCQGTLEEKRATRLQEYNGDWFVIENIPALVCLQCGEIYYTPQNHDLVVDIITGQLTATRLATVKVYDIAS